MTALILLSEWQRSQVEFWLPIPNYPHYDISNFGRIRSWYGTHKGHLRLTPRLRKPYKVSTGYMMIDVIRADGVGVAHGVHRLVAMAFIPNLEGKEQVNHKTGYKADCRLDGLEWKTKSENGEHAWRIGLIKESQKRHLIEASNRARRAQRTIPLETVKRVRQLVGQGLNYSEVGRRTNLHYATVRSIVLRIIYRETE